MLPRSRSGLEGLRLVLHLLDVPLLFALFMGAYWIRFHSGWVGPPVPVPPPRVTYERIFLVAALVWALVYALGGLYERIRFDARQALRLVGLSATASGATLAGLFFLRDVSYSRLVLPISFGLATVGIFVFHLLKAAFLLALLRRGYGRVPALVVGPAELALPCLARFAAVDDLGLDLDGWVGDPLRTPAGSTPPGSPAPGVSGAMAKPLIAPSQADAPAEDLGQLAQVFVRRGGLEDLERVVAEAGIQEIYVAYPLSAGPEAMRVIGLCERTAAAVRVVPDVAGIIAHGVGMRLVAGMPVLELGRSPMQGIEGFLKKVMDFVLASVGVVLISPLLLWIAWRVKRDSPGPVFYTQERVGLDGKTFTIYKFRSMPVDAEARTGPVWATKADPRATPFGSFIRRWSLDELPQLFNVIRGEMSLVGPRPERPHFVNRFRDDIRGYMQRHKVKAGMTGWAQINGLRGECPIEDRTRYDIWYIENWSLLLDLEILIRTVILCVMRPTGG